MRAFLPGARAVEVLRRSDRARLGRLEASDSGLFQGVVSERAPYLLRITWPGGVQETEDPYSFGPVLGDIDLHLFNEGRHFELAEALGANVMTIDGVRGTRFAVWAPNAGPRRGRRRFQHLGCAAPSDAAAPPLPASGNCSCRASAKARATSSTFVGPGGMRVTQKADPLAQQTELPPATASVVASPVPFRWRDDEWMRTRAAPARARCAALDLRDASRLLDAAGARCRGARRCGTSRSTG